VISGTLRISSAWMRASSAAVCSRLTDGSFSTPTITSPSSIVGMNVFPTNE